MVTFLITSVLLLGLFAIALYFWQKPANQAQTPELPPPADTRGLFDYDSDVRELAEASGIEADARRKTMLERAVAGDKEVLAEAHHSGGEVYAEVLDSLVANAQTPAQLLSLVSHVTRYELPVTGKLASAFIESWRTSPDRNSTTKMLHIAALSDDAEVYQAAADAALRAWRAGGLRDISATELQAILDGEFWILSARSRGSGAGFVLKRSLAAARRELQGTHNG